MRPRPPMEAAMRAAAQRSRNRRRHRQLRWRRRRLVTGYRALSVMHKQARRMAPLRLSAGIIGGTAAASAATDTTIETPRIETETGTGASESTGTVPATTANTAENEALSGVAATPVRARDIVGIASIEEAMRRSPLP